MILLLCLLWVPAALFVWRLCAVGAEADAQMEVVFEKMMQEKEQGRSQDAGGLLLGREDLHAG